MNFKKENLNRSIAPPSFVKLAMRNMVKKGSKSIFHFTITFLFLLLFILLVATIAKPNIPV